MVFSNVTRNSERTSITISQEKYILDMLRSAIMVDCQASDIPADPGMKGYHRQKYVAGLSA